ncbi:hypothetical protein HK098_003050 [Nowakowskiella sp. JEL0407]|nr:hypothetical protein HK098_003047 [Nowakowskiella sp. JEL0407]KAJ3128953.1 hypothetical protein HK098_003050 [Nowakowskiella sp. JEL0407]
MSESDFPQLPYTIESPDFSFDDPALEQLACALCFHLPARPVKIHCCGTSSCWPCINNWILQSHRKFSSTSTSTSENFEITCPFCNQQITHTRTVSGINEYEFSVDTEKQDILDGLDCLCPFAGKNFIVKSIKEGMSFREEQELPKGFKLDCGWNGCKKDLEDHLHSDHGLRLSDIIDSRTTVKAMHTTRFDWSYSSTPFLPHCLNQTLKKSAKSKSFANVPSSIVRSTRSSPASIKKTKSGGSAVVEKVSVPKSNSKALSANTSHSANSNLALSSSKGAELTASKGTGQAMQIEVIVIEDSPVPNRTVPKVASPVKRRTSGSNTTFTDKLIAQKDVKKPSPVTTKRSVTEIAEESTTETKASTTKKVIKKPKTTSTKSSAEIPATTDEPKTVRAFATKKRVSGSSTAVKKAATVSNTSIEKRVTRSSTKALKEGH